MLIHRERVMVSNFNQNIWMNDKTIMGYHVDQQCCPGTKLLVHTVFYNNDIASI